MVRPAVVPPITPVGERLRTTETLASSVGKYTAREGNQGLRAAELRFRDQHVLVRYFDLLEERVELRIAEDSPPFAAVEIVLRLRRFPLAPFLVGRGDLDLRPPVVGTDCATREREGEKCERASPHRAPSAAPRARPAHERRHHSRKRSRYRYTTGVV